MYVNIESSRVEVMFELFWLFEQVVISISDQLALSFWSWPSWGSQEEGEHRFSAGNAPWLRAVQYEKTWPFWSLSEKPWSSHI